MDSYDEFVAELVSDDAPRLFAVVREYGDREDADVAAWGMAFPDRAEVVGVERRVRMSLRDPERAARLFAGGDGARARLVWC
ncbi:hypothetical protein ACFFSW_24855 [Saccharothrix longispora]|uniref:SnoaL-like protein n=1 Tax=Saccharothrix longispora TaxID=33920 RepID=A0ABU1PX67_9PSEU|nr:hypothetical protein [Saccharothrix longispora]MBY8849305.1 hypothetical protein [Saccharothrix sp. MB29]MDR6595250.1 hypothetical protein [Saccharothrix longispora]MDU0288934.1 hypothetical protein [Saccharothrix longispora]